LGAALALLGTGAAGAAAQEAERPGTIPALREWRAAEGEWRLGAHARVVARCGAGAALRREARTLARDLRTSSGVPTTSPQCSSPRSGDVVLRRVPRAPLGDEGYRLRIGNTARITAPTSAGLFYGGRSLLQLLASGEPIPRGTAEDRPRYPERGLMVDVGRQYFTPGWIKDRIRELAYLKLNYLHLHLSDHQGFRIESDTHPEIVSKQHLTKGQVHSILAVARRHHVTVVPEIDMPGHMTAALAEHPELWLRNAFGSPERGVLDVTKPAARRFVRDLLGEYLRLFDGPYWHLGADEVLPFVVYPAGLYPSLEEFAIERYGPTANAKDAIHGFVNWVDQIVRRHGKTSRMWADDVGGGSAVSRDPGIVAEWWIDVSPLSDISPPTPQELLDAGYSIVNAGWYPTYYVNGVGGSPFLVRPDVETAYESWAVNRFHGLIALDPPDLVDPAEPRNLGSILHVWNDNPGLVSQAETAAAIGPGLRMLAQKTWNSPLLTPDYGEFTAIAQTIGGPPG
jgi:hexosaminidase